MPKARAKSDKDMPEFPDGQKKRGFRPLPCDLDGRMGKISPTFMSNIAAAFSALPGD
jgi:hypothetical protein